MPRSIADWICSAVGGVISLGLGPVVASGEILISPAAVTAGLAAVVALVAALSDVVAAWATGTSSAMIRSAKVRRVNLCIVRTEITLRRTGMIERSRFSFPLNRKRWTAVVVGNSIRRTFWFRLRATRRRRL